MNRRIVTMAGVAAAVLLAAWFFLLWSPKGSELADAHERKSTAEQKANELQLKLERLQDAQRQAPQLTAERDRLVSAVPDKSDLAQFILDTNDAASKAGVDFISVSPTPPAASKIPGAPSAVHVQLAVSGDYFATLNFLDRLTDLPRIVVIDQVQLRPGDKTSGKLSADLSGNVFTTEPPAALPGRPAAATTASSTTTTTVKP